MRLWHYKLIKFLPDAQLIAQWRELNSIFKKQDNHILINYVYEYPKKDLLVYSGQVIDEMTNRGFHIRSFKNYSDYFSECETLLVDVDLNGQPFKNHHNNRYLFQCFYNLQEKYDRGQKDFNKDRYFKLLEFCRTVDLPEWYLTIIKS